MIIFGVFNPEKGTAFDNAPHIRSDDEEKIPAPSRYRIPVFQSVANHTSFCMSLWKCFLLGYPDMSRISAQNNKTCLSADTGEPPD